jgi:hypothetical protein
VSAGIVDREGRFTFLINGLPSPRSSRYVKVIAVDVVPDRVEKAARLLSIQVRVEVDLEDFFSIPVVAFVVFLGVNHHSQKGFSAHQFSD